MDRPMVSVLTTAYNHAPFLAEAIESVLTQQATFAFEQVIGEDCSSDETRQIALDYQRRYPERIRVLEHDQNLGGRRNLITTFQACRGKYIAILEGDDYWISSEKLQQQVELMEAHSNYALCFTRAVKKYEQGAIEPIGKPRQTVTRSEYHLEDLLDRNLIRTCSVMYRAGLVKTFPDWFYATPTGDWPLHVLHALHGPIGYIDKKTAVHRVHSNSFWSPRKVSERRISSIKTLTIFKQHLPDAYRPQIETSIARWQFKVLNALRIEGNWPGLFHYAGQMILHPQTRRSKLIKAAAWALQGGH